MDTRSFVVNVGTIRRHPGASLSEHLVGSLPSLVVSESSVPEAAQIVADVDARSIIGGIDVSGKVVAPYESMCRRCLTSVEGIINADVHELFTANDGGSEEIFADDDTYHFTGDSADLAPLVRDAVLLNLPLAPLCRPNCAGLCPECGANHNETTCACNVDLTDPRWSTLDQLHEND